MSLAVQSEHTERMSMEETTVRELALSALEIGERQMHNTRLLLAALSGTPTSVSLETFRESQPTDAGSIVPPEFPPHASCEQVIIDFIATGQRTWRVAELLHFLEQRTDYTKRVRNPKSTLYQAVNRGWRLKRLSRPRTGVYGPPLPA